MAIRLPFVSFAIVAFLLMFHLGTCFGEEIVNNNEEIIIDVPPTTKPPATITTAIKVTHRPLAMDGRLGLISEDESLSSQYKDEIQAEADERKKDKEEKKEKDDSKMCKCCFSCASSADIMIVFLAGVSLLSVVSSVGGSKVIFCKSHVESGNNCCGKWSINGVGCGRYLNGDPLPQEGLIEVKGDKLAGVWKAFGLLHLPPSKAHT